MAEKSKKPAIRFAGFTEAWEQCKFEDITYLSGEKNRDNNIFESYSVTNDKGFVPQVEQFENGGTMATADKSMYYIVSKNSFAYNPARINVGSIGYYDKPEKVIVSSLYEVFKTINNINDHFLWHWFKSNAFQKMIEQYQEGGVRLYFYYDKLCVCSIDIPKYEEQYMIGEILDKIDNLITLHQRKYDKLVNVKKAMLEKMFSKDGADVPEIRFKGFTEAWEQRKLGELSSSFEYGLNAASKEFDGKNKYIRITDIDDDSHDFNQKDITSPDIDLSNADNFKLREGDILFARTGASVGKTYIYKSSHGLVYYAGFLIRARIKEEYNPGFVFQNTLTNGYQKFIKVTSMRSGQPGINALEYYQFELMVPEKAEQSKIGKYFRQLDNLITLHQRKCIFHLFGGIYAEYYK